MCVNSCTDGVDNAAKTVLPTAETWKLRLHFADLPSDWISWVSQGEASLEIWHCRHEGNSYLMVEFP